MTPKEAMKEWALGFSRWLEENTIIHQDTTGTTYQFGTTNYILDDIYTVFEEEMNK